MEETDIVVKKLMEEGVSLETAVDMAAWTHNTNVNILGFTLLQLVTGKMWCSLEF